MKDEDLIKQVRIETAQKIRELIDTSHKLYELGDRRKKDLFIADGFLDYYLTQIPPSKLAEYKRAITIKE